MRVKLRENVTTPRQEFVTPLPCAWLAMTVPVQAAMVERRAVCVQRETKMTTPSRPDANLTAHLRRLEEALLDPAVRRDRTSVLALLSSDFLEFGASGCIWTLESVLDLLAEEEFTPPAVEDFQCIPLGADAALLTWRSIRYDAQTGHQISSLRSSIWIRENGEWRMRFHQGTPTPET